MENSTAKRGMDSARWTARVVGTGVNTRGKRYWTITHRIFALQYA